MKERLPKVLGSESFRSRRALAAAVLPAVMLAGCGTNEVKSTNPQPTPGSSAPVETSPAVPTPEATLTPAPEEEVAPEDCGLRSVKVGEYFSLERENQIQAQLDLIKNLETERKLTFKDVLAAGNIVRYARKDPLYAQAIITARQEIQNGESLTAEEFLALPVKEPTMCSQTRIAKDDLDAQLFNTIEIGDYVVSETSKHLAMQGAVALASGFEVVQNEYYQWKEKIKTELENQP